MPNSRQVASTTATPSAMGCSTGFSGKGNPEQSHFAAHSPPTRAGRKRAVHAGHPPPADEPQALAELLPALRFIG
jgi:hypothetical protein